MSGGSIITEVKKHIEDNDLEVASHKLTTLLRGNPRSEVLLLSTIIKIRKGDPTAYETAWKAYEKAVQEKSKQIIASSLEHIAICLFKTKSFDDALTYAVHAKNVDGGKSPAILMLLSMIERKYMKKHGVSQEQLHLVEEKILSDPIPVPRLGDNAQRDSSDDKPTIQPDATVAPQTSLKTSEETITALGVEKNIRNDWFDAGKAIELSLYVKKVDPQSLNLNLQPNKINLTFKDSDLKEYEFTVENLNGNIIPEESSHKVYGTKVELILIKADDRHWSSLLSNADLSETHKTLQIPKDKEDEAELSYPSSSAKHIDWSKINLDDNDDDEKEDTGSGDPESFFRQLYENADDDARRAMMKSFMESKGTSLSTDWKDVGSREVKPYQDDDVKN